MARVVSAAASGSAASAPALIADMGADGVPIWRYAIGKNGPEGAHFPFPRVFHVSSIVLHTEKA